MNTISGDDWKRELKYAREVPNALSIQIKERIAKMNTYRIKYRIGEESRVADRHAGSPISALNSIHKELQLLKNLKPDDYKIDSIALFYNSDSTSNLRGSWIESTFDLPNTKNPDLRPRPQHPIRETQTMPFYEETINKDSK